MLMLQSSTGFERLFCYGGVSYIQYCTVMQIEKRTYTGEINTLACMQ